LIWDRQQSGRRTSPVYIGLESLGGQVVDELDAAEVQRTEAYCLLYKKAGRLTDAPTGVTD